MTLRKVKWILIAYVLCDLLIGYAGVIRLEQAAAAQFTQVNGTITDPNGLPYANGTISALLVTSASPTLSGLPYIPPTQPTGLDLNGNFTMQLADNTVLLPAATKWNFTVCSAIGTVLPAGGKGPVCFTLASPITISGASQSITANLNAVAPALTIAVAGTTINPTNGVIPVRANAGAFNDSALADNGTIVTSTEPIRGVNGTAATPSVQLGSAAVGIENAGSTTTFGIVSGSLEQFVISSAGAVETRQPICDYATATNCFTFAAGLISATGTGHPNIGFGTDKGQHVVSQAAQADSWGVATCAASTVTITFTRAYTSTPAIVVSDETAAGGARVSAKSNSAFTITCSGATDVVDYFTGGNPN